MDFDDIEKRYFNLPEKDKDNYALMANLSAHERYPDMYHKLELFRVKCCLCEIRKTMPESMIQSMKELAKTRLFDNWELKVKV